MLKPSGNEGGEKAREVRPAFSWVWICGRKRSGGRPASFVKNALKKPISWEVVWKITSTAWGRLVMMIFNYQTKGKEKSLINKMPISFQEIFKERENQRVSTLKE